MRQKQPSKLPDQSGPCVLSSLTTDWPCELSALQEKESKNRQLWKIVANSMSVQRYACLQNDQRPEAGKRAQAKHSALNGMRSVSQVL